MHQEICYTEHAAAVYITGPAAGYSNHGQNNKTNRKPSFIYRGATKRVAWGTVKIPSPTGDINSCMSNAPGFLSFMETYSSAAHG